MSTPTAAAPPVLVLDNVEVVYKRAITAVQGISINVSAGQIVAILGTNGAGKSTTLRAITGFLGLDDARITEGTIRFKGERIDNARPDKVARSGLVLVSERDKVFPNLTVEENLIVPASWVGAAERKRREAFVLERFPTLARLRARTAGLLSGGERQMLAIASALVSHPEVLLIDEFSLGLAPVVVSELAETLVAIRNDLDLTIVLVEQSAATALSIADYGYVLENGRVVLDGDGDRLRNHPDIQDFYLGQSSGERRSYNPSNDIAGTGGGMAELAIEDLSLRFGGLRVLDRVSFAVEAGELFALIGPNGAGKTSVLNCISGLYRGNGRIVFAGQDISKLAPAAIARLGLGRTFQHGELFPHMTVLDNLMTARHARVRTRLLDDMFFTRRAREEEARHRSKVEEIIEFVELERHRHSSVDDLPFGIQKIVGFARALATEPRLLLLDEPSAGLNRDEREDLARFVLRIKHELGIAMIWIEHDMQMIADLADRIHVLHYGETLASGTPEAVLSDARVVEAYLGIAAQKAPNARSYNGEVNS